MNEMMKLCCSQDGKPNFEKIKQFMEHCWTQKPAEKESPDSRECSTQEDATGVEKQKE